MTWRLNRRIALIPGIRANLSRSGVSVSVGHHGFWYTAGARRQRVTVGLPGTGLFYTETRPWRQLHVTEYSITPHGIEPGGYITDDSPRTHHRVLFVVLAWLAIGAVIAQIGGR